MSISASRVPTVISPVPGTTTGQTTAQSVEVTPLRTQRFIATQLKKPEDIARQMNELHSLVREATLPARSNPHNQHILFTGRHVDVAGTISLAHGLNRKVQWTVARWYDSSTGASFYEIPNGQTDPNVLVLASAAQGTADIEVW